MIGADCADGLRRTEEDAGRIVHELVVRDRAILRPTVSTGIPERGERQSGQGIVLKYVAVDQRVTRTGLDAVCSIEAEDVVANAAGIWTEQQVGCAGRRYAKRARTEV